MGDPKATEMPAAAAAESTSRFRAMTEASAVITLIEAHKSPSLLVKVPNIFISKLAQQQATWTKGPSLPSHRPDATAKH